MNKLMKLSSATCDAIAPENTLVWLMRVARALVMKQSKVDAYYSVWGKSTRANNEKGRSDSVLNSLWRVFMRR